MRQDDYIITLKSYRLYGIDFTFTGRIKYVKYPNNRLVIEVEISCVNDSILFNTPILKWIDSNIININYEPLPISETIVECGE